MCIRDSRIRDDSFLFLLNAHHKALEWTLPGARFGLRWKVEIDTLSWVPPDEVLRAGEPRRMAGRSLLLMRRSGPEDPGGPAPGASPSGVWP